MEHIFLDDIRTPNTALRIQAVTNAPLSASVWTFQRIERIGTARQSALRIVLATALEEMLDYEPWLFLSERALQPNTAVRRHYGLWKSFARQNMRVPSSFCFEECLQEGDRLRFFGAAMIGDSDLEFTEVMMRTEAASVLLLPSHVTHERVRQIVRNGWKASNFKPPVEILEMCVSEDAIAIEVFGEFDDPNVVVAAIGKWRLVDKLR